MLERDTNDRQLLLHRIMHCRCSGFVIVSNIFYISCWLKFVIVLLVLTSIVSTLKDLFRLIDWLVLYRVSPLGGYLMPNPVYIYIYIYIYIYGGGFNWITMIRKPGNHSLQHTETLDSCFDLIRFHQQCILWSPPREIEPVTTDCRVNHRLQSYIYIYIYIYMCVCVCVCVQQY